MKTITRSVVTALAALILAAAAHAQSPRLIEPLGRPITEQAPCQQQGGDAVICFRPLFVVDAYSTTEQATPNFQLLLPSEADTALLATTNDQTRRALVIYAWDYNVRGERAELPAGTDGFVAEFWGDPDDAEWRFARLTDDQRAGSIRFRTAILRFGRILHGTVIVFRTFGRQP